MSTRAVMLGKAAGNTVIWRETVASARPQASVAVHVSVTVPPQALGVAVKVEEFEVPEIRQPPLKPLVYATTLAFGNPPHATVISGSAVMLGKSAGFTVISRETEPTVLPQRSVAVHVSTTVPPQAPGITLKVLGFEVPSIKHAPPRPLL